MVDMEMTFLRFQMGGFQVSRKDTTPDMDWRLSTLLQDGNEGHWRWGAQK